MTKNVITKTVEVEEITYTANDGKVFNDEFECKCYENKMENEIMDAKFAKMFVPLNDAATNWINDSGWYIVNLVTEQDVVDFFTLANMKFNDHFYDGDKTRKNFIDDFMNRVRSGEVVELLLSTDCDGYYLSRFDITYTKEEHYKHYLELIDNMYKLADKMKKHIRFVPQETTENK